LIINCSPIGTHPNIQECPDLPYHALTASHFLYDMVYNPAQSLFLKQGQLRGAHTMNGLKMLQIQADLSWDIWNKKK
jgi:shikimate dehydrogenase